MFDRFSGRVRRVGTAWAVSVLPALAPALLFLPAVLAPPLNHDVAAVLSFSQRWLGGERLYTDLIDVNPPLIFVLNLIPAGIAELDAARRVQALRALPSRLWAFAGGWRSACATAPARAPPSGRFSTCCRRCSCSPPATISASAST